MRGLSTLWLYTDIIGFNVIISIPILIVIAPN
jgi:hypothetical protein